MKALTNGDCGRPSAGLSSTAIALAAGESHTCAALSGGGVLCWGRSQYGQLGNGNTQDSASPAAVGMNSGLSGVDSRLRNYPFILIMILKFDHNHNTRVVFKPYL
jgi:alpha-tubulin suppressor-like RCC1 family protein